MSGVRWTPSCRIMVLSICFASVPVAGQDGASAPSSRPVRVKITISRDTTYLLGPLNADGTINYVAALNTTCGKGVTLQNNAAVLLILAAGPDVIAEPVRSRTLKVLRMPLLPKMGRYFEDLQDYADREGTESDSDTARERLYKAGQGPWSARRYRFVADWLEDNEKPLELAVAASKARRYYIPRLSPSKPPRMVDIPLPSLSRFRSIAKALVVRSMLHAGSGKIEDARADLMAVHRLARLIGQGPTLVDRLYASSIEVHACRADAALAAGNKLRAANAKAHLADLKALPPLPSVIEAMDEAERFCLLDSAMLVARKGTTGLKTIMSTIAGEVDEAPEGLADQYPALDWDLILQTINKWSDRQVAIFRKASFVERKRAQATFDRDLDRLTDRIEELDREDWQRLGRDIKSSRAKPTKARQEASKTVAELLVSMMMPTLGRASKIYDRATMRRRVAEVALALAAYKAERGRYPRRLADLKPKHLTAIPNDLFTKKPLRYKRTRRGYLLYSVGPNMRNDDGWGRDDGEDGDDIAVRAK